MLTRILLLFLFVFPLHIFAQEIQQNIETPTDRPMNSIADQGWYWDNGGMLRHPYIGGLYRMKLYYRFALHRNKNSFWFKDSALELGLEQYFSVSTHTYAYLFWQPIIAFNITVKAGYSTDFLGFTALNGSTDNYNFALPPVTGLNPMNRIPNRLKNINVFEFIVSPTWMFGGSIGDHGMMALIYNPTMSYIHAFGMNKNQYYFDNTFAIVLKSQDIYWKHDIKLGYIIKGSGISVALTGLIEHIQSIAGVFRAGLYGSFSYEKSLKKAPNIIPYFKSQIGAIIHDRYTTGDFAIQIDTGIKYKF